VRAPNPAGQPTVDGRAARAARTRDAVVHALLALLAEGDVRPTAGRIAERAGISLRSVYVHFDDRDDLFNAAAREQRNRVLSLTRKLPATGPFETRLADFVEQRCRVLEAIAPVAKAAAVQEPFSPALAATTKTARHFSRSELERVFATELASIDTPTRDRVLDACDALTGAEGWAFLRVHRGLDEGSAAETLATSLRLLLGAGSTGTAGTTEATASAHRRARRWRARPPARPGDRGGEERR
jgi:TetR/AcrR family transcriptional regulator, regulator of autoinduction and epiphytic fitness